MQSFIHIYQGITHVRDAELGEVSEATGAGEKRPPVAHSLVGLNTHRYTHREKHRERETDHCKMSPSVVPEL